jgi:hypothetical protein
MRRLILPALSGTAVAALLMLAAPALAQDGASYAGESVDPVTGYRCLTPFCDTVALPETDCLCQKLNPNETRRDRLELACTDIKTRQQCAASPN